MTMEKTLVKRSVVQVKVFAKESSKKLIFYEWIRSYRFAPGRFALQNDNEVLKWQA